jgi:hypothetical protein
MIDWIDMIPAAAVVIVVFLAMRILYGCWPWERRKLWRYTRHRIAKQEQGPLFCDVPNFQPLNIERLPSEPLSALEDIGDQRGTTATGETK